MIKSVKVEISSNIRVQTKKIYKLENRLSFFGLFKSRFYFGLLHIFCALTSKSFIKKNC